MNARVWLNQASIVSLVSLVFRDRMVAAGAAGKEWFANILKKKSEKISLWVRHLLAGDVGSCGEQEVDAVSSVLAGGIGLRVSGVELALGQLGLRISGVLPSLLARIWGFSGRPGVLRAVPPR